MADGDGKKSVKPKNNQTSNKKSGEDENAKKKEKQTEGGENNNKGASKPLEDKKDGKKISDFKKNQSVKKDDSNNNKKNLKMVDSKGDEKIVDPKRDKSKKDDTNSKDGDEGLDPEAIENQSNDQNENPEEEVEILPRLCPSCNEIARRWPPPPFVDPNPRDPSLLYPGDEDPEFKPARGDAVIIHPGLNMGLMVLHRKLPKDGFVSCYDGSPEFQFGLGDLVVRIGTYDETAPTIEPSKSGKLKKGERGSSNNKKGDKGSPRKPEEQPKKGEKKSKVNDEKSKKADDRSKAGKNKDNGIGNQDGLDMKARAPEPYHPYTKLELYTCSGFITAEEEAKMEEEKLKAEEEKKKLDDMTNSKKKKGPKGKDGNKGKGLTAASKEEGGKKKGQDKDKDKTTENSPNDKSKTDDSTAEKGSMPLEIVNTPPLKPKWRYLGGQMELEIQSQNLLEKQCPGLTYIYRKWQMPGAACDAHTVSPILGDILINLGWHPNWYKNREKWQKEENKYKSLIMWHKPHVPSRGNFVPGMILLRPMVGRERGEWPGWGLDGRKVPPPLPSPPPLSLEDGVGQEQAQGNEEGKEEEGMTPPPKCDCHRKSPCPKPPCPCHLYDPCPKLPGCTCIYCNPLPRKPKELPKTKDEEEDTKSLKGKEKGKGKNAKKNKNEKGGKTQPSNSKGSKEPKETGKELKKSKISPRDKKDGKAAAKGKGNPKGGNKGELKGEEEVKVLPKPYVWGRVEMYLFHGDDEGWEYWGRAERICDTPYPINNETSKPKFFHEDDRIKLEEVVSEEKVVHGIDASKDALDGKSVSNSETPLGASLQKNAKREIQGEVKEKTPSSANTESANQKMKKT